MKARLRIPSPGGLSPGPPRGFTLIELSLVIVIIGILMVFLIPKGMDVLYRAKLTACEKNMHDLFSWYTMYKEDHGYYPKEHGAKNFLSLWDVVEHTDANAKGFTCPEPDPPDALFDMEKGRLKEAAHWFEPWDQVDGSYTRYAGRDTKAHRMSSLSGTEPLLCDDNEDGPNHKAGVTLALFGNGEVKKFRHADLKKEGILPPETDNLEIGPDSPVESLRKLTRD